MIKSGNIMNGRIAIERLGYELNNAKIIAIYDQISKD